MRCGLGGLGCRGPQDHGFQSFFGLPFTLSVEMEGTYDFWSFSPEVRFNKVRQGVLVRTGVMLEKSSKYDDKGRENTWIYPCLCFLAFPFVIVVSTDSKRRDLESQLQNVGGRLRSK